MKNLLLLSKMKILVDADACPNLIKEILFKAAIRTNIKLMLIANHYMRIPKAANIFLEVVEKGFDVADNEIVKLAQSDDLVITSDIPLADELIDKGAIVVTPRGEELDKHNIKSRLNTRDFMDTMRASGIQTGGPAPLNQKDKQNFANSIDRILQRAK